MDKKLRASLVAEMETRDCARANEGTCAGRKTIEHVFGRVKEARWNCLILCWHHHLVDLNKELNCYLAYSQATEEDIKAGFPKTYKLHLIKRDYLNKLYGIHGRRKEGISGS